LGIASGTGCPLQSLQDAGIRQLADRSHLPAGRQVPSAKIN